MGGYKADDLHQNVRRSTGLEAVLETLYVNIFNMNPGDDCAVSGGNKTKGGFPCNANTQFIQHGYSTTLRDSTYDEEDPDRQKRFDFWFGKELVKAKYSATERVLLFDGFGRMLARARPGKGETRMLSGDLSGEWSLGVGEKWEGSNMQKYHPEITEPQDYLPLSAWQPTFAWSGWWYAFARTDHETGVEYFTESDLKAMFLEGRFPDNWVKRDWGFDKAFKTTLKLKGLGLGDEWIEDIENNMLLLDDAMFAEKRYSLNAVKTFIEHGFLKPYKSNSYQV